MKKYVSVCILNIFLIMCVLGCCACGEEINSEEAGSKIQETETGKNPDELYELKITESTVSNFSNMEEKEEWYGDYKFIEYIRPHFGFQPNPDKEQRQRILDYQKQSIVSLSENSVKYLGSVNREDEPDAYEDYKYDHYVMEASYVLKTMILDEKVLQDITSRWGREYHLDGTPVDFSEWAYGDESYFADIDFKVSDYEGHYILIFYDEQNPSTIKEREYWIDAGNGVVYSLTDQMVSKWQKIR
ncbi:hypothetical protein [Qiania dongpingensis]|uniref:Lipoprotein n=1 Tax=Qiania dongpingensis TaxID=2763669 RepID=A0A7G9G386_9FIRM|nr:hypothetical protein [Qiania dongpingensis]QNM05268.1 hypothetical protein H9Q78_12605 [Qiania dongpingensis]